MIDNEIIGMAKRIARGVTVDDDTLAYNVIEEVGPQGNFLTHDHTFEHFREEFYDPFISNRQNYDAWIAGGGVTVENQASLKWKQMLEAYVEPHLDAGTDAALRKYFA